MSDRRVADDEEAPYSRLFVVASKDLREDDIKNAFEKFGDIKDVTGVKDRTTGDYKGIFYVKFYKTSNAACALEEMKGFNLGGRSIKVMIAYSREAGQDAKTDIDEETLKRLFIVVSKTADDDELYNHFKQFGSLEYASIVQDRETKQNKQFAYVKFYKFSDAARAVEECDRKYKAVFAKPRKSRAELLSLRSDPYHNPSAELPSYARNDRAHPNDLKEDGFFPLSVIASFNVNQSQLWKLFDIVPSMDYCQVQYDDNHSQSNKYEVVYKTEYWAEYAIEKFHGFEYPPGERLIVKPSRTPESNARFGLAPDACENGMSSKPLPPRKPMAEQGSEAAVRLFVVCIPNALSPAVLKDVFCRFGNLMEIYMLHNRNYGYAKYSSKQSGEKAIEVLHGIEIKGIRLSVVEAQERPDKRQKMDT